MRSRCDLACDLAGKKPFKKKFQKYKNTDDKVKLCKAGQVEDPIEEKNINSKLAAANGARHTPTLLLCPHLPCFSALSARRERVLCTP